MSEEVTTKTVQDLEHLSHSSITTYMLCPRSWKFRYLDKIESQRGSALAFGSATHDTIEQTMFFKLGLPMTAEVVQKAIGDLDKDITADYEALAQDVNKTIEEQDYSNVFMFNLDCQYNDPMVDMSTDSYNELLDLGQKVFSDTKITDELFALKPQIMADTAKPAIERKISLDVPGVPIPVIGYIDIITEDGVPGDFKTSKRKWGATKADDELQAAFYLIGLSQQFGIRVDQLPAFRYYVIVKTKKPYLQVVETTRTPAQLFFIYDLVKSVWDAIEAESFPMNAHPSNWKCSPKWCEYWSICRGRHE